MSLTVKTETRKSEATAASNAQFQAVRDLVASDFDMVDSMIDSLVSSRVITISDVGKYIIAAGGKRLRPLIVLLTVRECGYQGDDHIRLATLIEFLHTATLLHDDVVDTSERRRGRASANALWGNPTSVLVGDFLYSRAFQLMVQINRMDVISIISDATNNIAEGEVKQLENIGNVDLTEEEYLEIIRCKSALLFEAAAHTAAVLANSPTSITQSLRSYGLHLGFAFQIVDDLLDYSGDSTVLGKDIGDDLSEGKTTLPLIYAMQHCDIAEATMIRSAIETQKPKNVPAILSIVKASGALQYTRDRAKEHTEKAIAALRQVSPTSPFKGGLETLAKIALHRVQ